MRSGSPPSLLQRVGSSINPSSLEGLASECVTEVKSEKDLKGVPYSQQGNKEYYTPKALAQREANRTHPLVVAALQNFWEAVTYESTHADLITRDEYIDIFSKIGLALLEKGETPNPSAAREAAEAAWGVDSEAEGVSSEGLGKELWFDTLFELADLWTATLEPRECTRARTAHTAI